MTIEFQKFHGNGNDFVFLDYQKINNTVFFPKSLEQLRDFVSKICNRNTGIGADGVVFTRFRKDRKDSSYVGHNFEQISDILVVNSDGSFAGTCGNALRCLGLKYLQEEFWDGKNSLFVNRLVPEFILENEIAGGEKFIFEKGSFAVLLEGSLSSETVSVAMGKEKYIQNIPITEEVEKNLKFADLKCVFVELANPHLVFVAPEFLLYKSHDFTNFGHWAQYELPALLNKRNIKIPLSNISMVHSNWNDFSNYSLVVYERGAGLTLCCGSGAVASRVALESLGYINANFAKISFNLPGGCVEIGNWLLDNEMQRTLSGPAKFVFSGTW